ncbi:hypothetical protein [Streptomyces sp. NPDC058254]|uniref:hypothetical protein n=1 Tax=Streptomyces sp. NPDC058254 TaxID=3346406 RepID=UPI0036EE6232
MSREGVRFCWTCQQPIRPGEQTRKTDVFSASGPGVSVEFHTRCPVTPPPYQRAPVSRRH